MKAVRRSPHRQDIYLAAFVAHRDCLVVCLEVGHRHDPVLEVHGEIAVHVFARLGFVQELGLYPGIVQLVMHFADLDQKIAPLLVVEREQSLFFASCVIVR